MRLNCKPSPSGGGSLTIGDWDGRLIIVAHPDDEVLSCYSQMPGALVLVVTDGDNGRQVDMELHDFIMARRKESTEAARQFDGCRVLFMCEDEDSLNCGHPRIKVRLQQFIKWAKPKTIFVHHPNDENPGHRALGTIVRTICDQNSDIHVYYYSTLPQSDPVVIERELAESEWNRKLEILGSYTCQNPWLTNWVKSRGDFFKTERFFA